MVISNQCAGWKTDRWNYLLFAISSVVLFVLFTNAIPLVQLGLIPEIGSKTRHANLIRIFVIIYSLTLGVMYLTNKARFMRLSFIQYFLTVSEVQIRRGVFALFLCYAISGSLIGHVRHMAFETRAFDLGIFSQVLWNSLHGSYLVSSIKNNICYLGDHFSPLLTLLIPIYALFSDPRILLVLQSCMIALCIPAVYQFSNFILKDSKSAFVFALIFFFYLPARGPLHEDFHPETLIEFAIIYGFYFMLKARWFMFALCSVLVLSAKENMAGILFIYGVYGMAFLGRRKLGAALVIFSLLYFIVITKYMIPHIGGAPYLYAGSYDEIIKDPVRLLAQLFSNDSLKYIGKVFLPLLFVSFFHFPSLLLTFPILLQNLISENPAMRSFNYHYTVGLTAFVFISGVYGWQQLTSRVRTKPHAKYLLLLLIFVSLMRLGPSEYYYYYNSMKNISPEKADIKAQLSLIEDNASILTHNNIIPQAVNRRFIYQFEYNSTPSKKDSVLLLKPDYVIMSPQFWEPKTDPIEIATNSILSEGYFKWHQSPYLTILKKEDSESA